VCARDWLGIDGTLATLFQQYSYFENFQEISVLCRVCAINITTKAAITYLASQHKQEYQQHTDLLPLYKDAHNKYENRDVTVGRLLLATYTEENIKYDEYSLRQEHCTCCQHTAFSFRDVRNI